MSIKIIKPGVLATLQDTGRCGYRNIGIGSGGGMDFFAMEVANYLAGNSGKEAVLEINFPAPEILFEQDAIIGMAGADFNAVVNEKSIPPWHTLFIKRNSILRWNKPVNGWKSYLSVRGGWNAEKWLGSYSTHLKLNRGGHYGRALQKEDRILFEPFTFPFSENKILPWQVSSNELNRIYQPSYTFRCIRGTEFEMLDQLSKQSFAGQFFAITTQSDRMGFRLSGPRLLRMNDAELISSPVDAGTIQLLPDGNCILLMADHQTTGGYPRIASVIRADLPKLAQARPGQSISFQLINISEAESKLLEMEKVLEEIKTACYLNLKNHITLV